MSFSRGGWGVLKKGAMQPRVITETALRDRRSGMDRRSDERLRDPDRRALVRRVAERVPEEIRRDLEGWQKAGTSSPDLFERLISRTGVCLAQSFAVGPEDVAILLVKDQGRLLRFAYPVPHYAGRTNVFPVHTSSIAGEVLVSRRGRIDNEVGQVRHLDIYERIRGKEKRSLEIQKMVTAPLLLAGGKAFGVVQVSRRGKSSKEAGPDFPSFDLLKLRDLGRELGPIIHQEVPTDF
jgi:hypothetical protein